MKFKRAKKREEKQKRGNKNKEEKREKDLNCKELGMKTEFKVKKRDHYEKRMINVCHVKRTYKI